KTYSNQTKNLYELLDMLEVNNSFVKTALADKGLSIEQVLWRFDFAGRTFADGGSLLAAIRKELKQDLGQQDAAIIDRTLPDHPLAPDKDDLSSPVIDLLMHFDPTGNVKDLILENTEIARDVMSRYRALAAHPVSDTILFKSLLATRTLQKSGSLF